MKAVMWVGGPSYRGTLTASVEHNRSTYQIYQKLNGRGWEQISIAMNHKQAEEHWLYDCNPTPVSPEFGAWLDAEVANLLSVTRAAR